jgi:hypothetical protein
VATQEKSSWGNVWGNKKGRPESRPVAIDVEVDQCLLLLLIWRSNISVDRGFGCESMVSRFDLAMES